MVHPGAIGYRLLYNSSLQQRSFRTYFQHSDAGIGVIIDWVPAHFPSDEFALSRFDGTYLFEQRTPDRGSMLSGELFVIITAGLRFEAF